MRSDKEAMIPRELTREERTAIRKLVTSMCANYDAEYGCLPLDGPCYMLGKWWTGSYCKYFRDAVLPIDLALEAVLTAGNMETRLCAECGQSFPVSGKWAYCSAVCKKTAVRRQKREYMKRKRGECGNLPD